MFARVAAATSRSIKHSSMKSQSARLEDWVIHALHRVVEQ